MSGSCRNVSSDSGSPPASSSGTRSAIDLFFGLRLSSTPTSPNWKEPSTRATRLPGSDAAATARLTAIVVRPTPPFGEKTATTRPGSWPAAVASLGGRGRRVSHALLVLSRVHLADGGRQLVGAERLDKELAGPCQHGAPKVVRLALDGHHHDRGRRDLRREQLGRGDPVHVRHVDVHQDDIRQEPGRHLERLRAGRGGTDDLDVLLEAEQLRQVIAGLRDVVDDQDADLVTHAMAGAVPSVAADGSRVAVSIGVERWRAVRRGFARQQVGLLGDQGCSVRMIFGGTTP